MSLVSVTRSVMGKEIRGANSHGGCTIISANCGVCWTSSDTNLAEEGKFHSD